MTFNLLKRNKKNQEGLARRSLGVGGFTIVETLVAISILTISLMATFTAVQRSLQSSSFTSDQITAFYLVQEVMEYVRNVRDTNVMSGKDWMAGLIHDDAGVSGGPCDTDTTGKACTIDSPNAQVATCSGDFGSCPFIKKDSGTGLFQYTTGNPTKFKREVKIEKVDPSNDHEVVITVNMSWTSGSFSKQFQVKQTLMKWQ